MSLAGKRVVITGAAGALGRGVTALALEQGAEVLAVDLAFPPDWDAARHGRTLVTDLADAEATRAAFEAVGRIDGLFNLAGAFTMGPRTWEVTGSDWEQMFRINVTTLRNAVRATVPGMLERGRGTIVNVGALGALKGQGQMSAYCSAKSVVMRLTESLSAELKGKGINVNAVLPSMIDTPRNRADMPGADHTRWVSPRDLGAVICFLGSDAARAVHGALLPVTGLV
jgi:NAD(P)-dependent dehydrogenase (short-subunit alcohol dehydrogenase family)